MKVSSPPHPLPLPPPLPPRTTWPHFVISTARFAPTPPIIMLAMSILGGGAAICASAAAKKEEESPTSSSSSSSHHGKVATPSSYECLCPPAANPLLLATSYKDNIIATSDASAERSASMAAAAKTFRKSSSSSNDTLPLSSNTTTNSFKNQEGGSTSTRANRFSHPAIRTPFSPIAKEVSENNEDNEDDDDENDGDQNDDDTYPTFTHYHHSLLKKYLTPQIWSRLSHLHTSFGTTIEDIIRPGLALPMGAHPPRRVGVLVADAECYAVFRELLIPIISEYHGIHSYEEWMDPELPMESYFRKMAQLNDSRNNVIQSNTTTNGNNSDIIMKSSGADDDSDEDDDSLFFLDEEGGLFEEDVIVFPKKISSTTSTTSLSTKSTNITTATATTPSHVEAIASKRKGILRRHPTIINNPRLVTSRVADPDGKYIVSTRIRVARSLDGIRFPSSMSRSDRRYVERLIGDCTRNFRTPQLANGSYISVLSMTNDLNLDLIERHVLFDNPNEWTIASGLGRDWPDGRALYANVTNVQSQTPDFMIWVNEEDHLRIMCLRKGGDIQGVFTTLWNGLRELERELSVRGWRFVYDGRLGYLTSCPTNVGTAMRASVHVRLVNLGQLPGFFELVERLKLEVRGMYGETDRYYTGIFDISNAERLGKSEVHLINVMVEGVAKLIELERRLEAGERVDIGEIARS